MDENGFDLLDGFDEETAAAEITEPTEIAEIEEDVEQEDVEQEDAAEDFSGFTEYSLNSAPAEPVKKPRSLGRIAAVAAIIGILVGAPVAAGFGFGVGLAANRFSNTAEKNEPPQVTAEPFKFPDISAENAVLPAGASTDATIAPSAVTPPREADVYDTGVANVYSFSSVIERVEPSVVSIVSSSASSGGGFFGFDTPFTAAGSGIVFHEDAEKYYIVTNYHVVEKAQTVKISFGGKGDISAKLVGKKDTADVAVISISKEDVKKEGISVVIAKFGDSDALKVGDVVLAIGNALGEGNSATNGIISAKNKKITIENVTYNALQTNAAINAGNSGGALVNLNGEVVGVNSAKISTRSTSSSGVVEGMGYAIPSNDIKALIEELMGPKKPILGISGSTVSAEYAEHFGLPQAGVLVNEVFEGYPAEKGGILPSDIISAFDGHTVFTFEDLKAAIAQCSDGQQVTVNIIRGDDKTLVTLTFTMFTVEDENF